MDHQKPKNVNIPLLSFGFMLVYIYSTIIPIRTLIIDSAKNESSSGYVDGFNGDGSFSISICNVVLAIANFFALPILSKIGPRLTLILGGICYSFFIAQMVYPNDYMLYSASALAGFGIALLWVAHSGSEFRHKYKGEEHRHIFCYVHLLLTDWQYLYLLSISRLRGY